MPASLLVLLDEPVPLDDVLDPVEPVLDDVLPGVVELPVPLLDVPPPGVVLGEVEEVLLESRVVLTSSRFVQAVREARASRVMAPAWANLVAFMADPLEVANGSCGSRTCRCLCTGHACR